jgi:inositol oxygenase
MWSSPLWKTETERWTLLLLYFHSKCDVCCVVNLPSLLQLELNNLIDSSDPDLALPNIQHLFQTAEGLRSEGRPDWMVLVGLLHDLGKMMFLFGCEEDGTGQLNQFGMVGDVFVVGCALPDACVYPEYNALNPDMSDPRYNTELGIYQEGCGLDNVQLAWGHE